MLPKRFYCPPSTAVSDKLSFVTVILSSGCSSGKTKAAWCLSGICVSVSDSKDVHEERLRFPIRSARTGSVFLPACWLREFYDLFTVLASFAGSVQNFY